MSRQRDQKPDYEGAAKTLVWIVFLCLVTTFMASSIWWMPVLLDLLP